MHITKKLSMVTVLASLSWATHAAGFNYNYGQVELKTGDFDGLALTGSFVINKDFFVIANYTDTTNDEFGADIDFDVISLGAGYHMPVDPATDAVFTVSLASVDVGAPASEDDSGLLLTAGLRHNLNSDIELAGGVHHISAFDGESGLFGEARYNINNTMSAGLTFTTGDYLDGVGLNFRMGF